jgi:hypothetical protein
VSSLLSEAVSDDSERSTFTAAKAICLFTFAEGVATALATVASSYYLAVKSYWASFMAVIAGHC